MFAQLSIRHKLAIGVGGLCVIVLTLSAFVVRAAFAYKELARTLTETTTEGPATIEMVRLTGDMRVKLSQIRSPNGFSLGLMPKSGSAEKEEAVQRARVDFKELVRQFRDRLKGYRTLLEAHGAGRDLVGFPEEKATLKKIEGVLKDLDDDRLDGETLNARVNELADFSTDLPTHLQGRVKWISDEVRNDYRVWIYVSCMATLLSCVILPSLLWMFYRWVIEPLNVLIEGSRRVARNDYGHRIQLKAEDEMGELASAMNAMIDNFQRTRDVLDDQVRQRTAEVVRSEQLASVGFLAAGVAHEINNPLASIAWAAEALESRLAEFAEDSLPNDESKNEFALIRKYLVRIQEEAFRCKGITERLVDFSRLGDVEKHATPLKDLVQGVIDMVRHIGKYRQKKIEFTSKTDVIAPINPQAIKQVVLNLITNGLDSLEPSGVVTVELAQRGPNAELLVRDNGCGMTEEVLKHLYEPFFTRRRDGQGTGLGLSITHRIVVDDHGGRIEAQSAGVGKGSTFRVTLPLEKKDHEKQRRQAA